MKIAGILKDINNGIQKVADCDTNDDKEDAIDELQYLMDTYIESELYGLGDTLDETIDERDSLENELNSVKDDVAELENELEELREENRCLECEVTSLHGEVATLEGELNHLTS